MEETKIEDLRRARDTILADKKQKKIFGRIPLAGHTWNPLKNFPRNEPCFCGSGKKFKKCCLDKMGTTVTIKECENIKKLLKGKGENSVNQPTFKVPRALSDIQAQYNNVCVTAGDLQYKILCLKEQLAGVNEQLKEINQEAQARMNADNQAKQEAEALKAKAQADEEAQKAEEAKKLELVSEPATGERNV